MPGMNHASNHVEGRVRVSFMGLALVLALLSAGVQAQSAWLVGEQHDQAEHQRQAAELVAGLASQGRLHAVVIEMARRGRDTRGLPRSASEAQVREALAWNEAGWPWATYRSVVMNAVQAGVPVLGGDLPREALRPAMGEPRWDTAVPESARELLLAAVDAGHCGLVPPAQLGPMVRMQIARDRSLAEAVADAGQQARPDAVVLMLGGAAHASRETGVPWHLPAVVSGWTLRTIGFAAGGSPPPAGFDEVRAAARVDGPDPCIELRRRGMPAPAAPAAAVPPPTSSAP